MTERSNWKEIKTADVVSQDQAEVESEKKTSGKADSKRSSSNIIKKLELKKTLGWLNIESQIEGYMKPFYQLLYLNLLLMNVVD